MSYDGNYSPYFKFSTTLSRFPGNLECRGLRRLAPCARLIPVLKRRVFRLLKQRPPLQFTVPHVCHLRLVRANLRFGCLDVKRGELKRLLSIITYRGTRALWTRGV